MKIKDKGKIREEIKQENIQPANNTQKKFNQAEPRGGSSNSNRSSYRGSNANDNVNNNSKESEDVGLRNRNEKRLVFYRPPVQKTQVQPKSPNVNNNLTQIEIDFIDEAKAMKLIQNIISDIHEAAKNIKKVGPIAGILSHVDYSDSVVSAAEKVTRFLMIAKLLESLSANFTTTNEINQSAELVSSNQSETAAGAKSETRNSDEAQTRTIIQQAQNILEISSQILELLGIKSRATQALTAIVTATSSVLANNKIRRFLGEFVSEVINKSRVGIFVGAASLAFLVGPAFLKKLTEKPDSIDSITEGTELIRFLGDLEKSLEQIGTSGMLSIFLGKHIKWSNLNSLDHSIEKSLENSKEDMNKLAEFLKAEITINLNKMVHLYRKENAHFLGSQLLKLIICQDPSQNDSIRKLFVEHDSATRIDPSSLNNIFKIKEHKIIKTDDTKKSKKDTILILNLYEIAQYYFLILDAIYQSKRARGSQTDYPERNYYRLELSEINKPLPPINSRPGEPSRPIYRNSVGLTRARGEYNLLQGRFLEWFESLTKFSLSCLYKIMKNKEDQFDYNEGPAHRKVSKKEDRANMTESKIIQTNLMENANIVHLIRGGPRLKIEYTDIKTGKSNNNRKR